LGKLYNKKEQTGRRKSLRKSMTKAETYLWLQIKGKKINNCKFRRQFGIGKYILDNYSPEIKLAIEVDGVTHVNEEEKRYDLERQIEIEEFGVTFLRFTNEEIYEAMGYVLDSINKKIFELRNKTPSG